MLEVVDRTRRIARRRPGETHVGLFGRFDRQRPMVRHASRHRAHDVERVERRDARPHVAHLGSEPRVRQVEPIRRRAHRQPQQKALGRRAVRARDESRISHATCIVRQQRILTDPLRKDALGQAGDEHDGECPAANLMGRSDEHAAVPPWRWVPVERQQTRLQKIADLLQRDRPDRRHRSKIGEHAQHPAGAAEDTGREIRESIEPFAPRGAGGPVTKRVDDRQRERAQMPQVSKIPRDGAAAGRLRFFPIDFCQAHTILGSEPVEGDGEPLDEKIAALLEQRHLKKRDLDCRFDNQLFPFPRRAQRAGHDRLVFGVGKNRIVFPIGIRAVRSCKAGIRFIPGDRRRSDRAGIEAGHFAER